MYSNRLKRKWTRFLLICLSFLMLINYQILGCFDLSYGSNFGENRVEARGNPPYDEVNVSSEHEHRQDLDFLLKIIDNFDGEVSTGTVEASVNMKNTRMTTSEMEVLLDEISEQLGLGSLLDEKFVHNTEFGNPKYGNSGNLISLSGSTDSLHLQIVIQSKSRATNSQESFLILKATKLFEQTDKKFDSISKYQTQFSSILNSLHLDGEITTCFSGFLNGKLTEDEQNDFLQAQFRDHGIIQKEYFDKFNKKITAGYSEKIENFILVEDQKTNLSISLSNECSMDKTSFRIAIPLIYSDY